MQLGDVLLKLATDQALSVQEKEFLRLEGNKTQMMNSQTASMSGGAGRPSLNGPVVREPEFMSSPLRVFHCYRTTDVEITNNTDTPIVFETSRGDTSVFDFYDPNNLSKIRIDRTQHNIHINGISRWEGNSTGYRALTLEVFDADDVSIATQEISNVAAVPTEPTTTNFSYIEDIRSIFSNAAYFKLSVKQNSGAGLDIVNFVLAVCIA